MWEKEQKCSGWHDVYLYLQYLQYVYIYIHTSWLVTMDLCVYIIVYYTQRCICRSHANRNLSLANQSLIELSQHEISFEISIFDISPCVRFSCEAKKKRVKVVGTSLSVGINRIEWIFFGRSKLFVWVNVCVCEWDSESENRS